MKIKMKLIKILILIFVFIACKNSTPEIENTEIQKENLEINQAERDSLLKRDIVDVTEELIFMYEFDQVLRDYYIYKSFDKFFVDSIKGLSHEHKTNYLKNNQFQSDIGKKIMSEYIIPTDEKHTERLMEITNTYGFPNVNRLKQFYNLTLDEKFDPLLLFIHAPKKYWDELKIIMEQEYKIGNINKCHYGYLLWHFNGRNDFQYFLNYGYEYVEEDGVNVLKPVDCD